MSKHSKPSDDGEVPGTVSDDLDQGSRGCGGVEGWRAVGSRTLSGARGTPGITDGSRRGRRQLLWLRWFEEGAGRLYPVPPLRRDGCRS